MRIEALGVVMVAQLTYHEHWVVAFQHPVP